jgi:hypothetical protein
MRAMHRMGWCDCHIDVAPFDRIVFAAGSGGDDSAETENTCQIASVMRPEAEYDKHCSRHFGPEKIPPLTESCQGCRPSHPA